MKILIKVNWEHSVVEKMDVFRLNTRYEKKCVFRERTFFWQNMGIRAVICTWKIGKNVQNNKSSFEWQFNLFRMTNSAHNDEVCPEWQTYLRMILAQNNISGLNDILSLVCQFNPEWQIQCKMTNSVNLIARCNKKHLGHRQSMKPYRTTLIYLTLPVLL